jgi:signal peptidase I
LAKSKPKNKQAKGRKIPATRVSERGPEKPTGRQVAMEWGRSILFAVALAMIFRWPILEPFKIPSGSMEPTFFAGDRIFVNKYQYGVRYPFNGFRIPFTLTNTWYADSRLLPVSKPGRFDIVVFKAVMKGAPKDTLVKRIVGLPGERIHIAGGKVYVNGEVLELDEDMPDLAYTSPPPGFTSSMRYGIREGDEFALVPEGHYLVLGDNSGNSSDGRFFGWLPERNILGRVSSIWWPIPRWRDLTGFSDKAWWNTILALLGALTVVRLFFGQSIRVHESALPGAVAPGEHLYVNRIAFGLPLPFTRLRLTGGRTPRRGELVLYLPPKGSEYGNEIVLGRVAALPNESVFLDKGRLAVDDAPVAEPVSLADTSFASKERTGPYGRSKGKEYSSVPEGHYFLLVNDIETGIDSRDLGWIPMENILGCVSTVWWPLTRIRRVRG